MLGNTDEVSESSVPTLNIQNSFEHQEIDNVNNEEMDDDVTNNEAPKSKHSFLQLFWIELQNGNSIKKG